jgi:type I restriction-modification system DNA methylase subunit
LARSSRRGVIVEKPSPETSKSLNLLSARWASEQLPVIGQTNLGLYGQEYNDESWAICCSDMLIKDEETDHIILGDTLGDGKTGDGFQGRQFHYMLANPPFGVEWKDQQKVIEKEAKELGFSGRFGAGLPAINDGSLLLFCRSRCRCLLRNLASKRRSLQPVPDADGA